MSSEQDLFLAKKILDLQLATKQQVEECLKIQKKLKDKNYKLVEILIKKQYINSAQLSFLQTKFPHTHDNQNVLGRYKIIKELGRGGMGKVYKAYDPELSRTIAIKVMLTENPDEKNLRYFKRESKIIANLDHSNIVKIFDIGVHEGNPFFAMEYIEGNSLAGVLQQGLIPLERTLEIVRDIAEAIVYLHDNKVLHLDLKPANIMINQNQQVKVMDFGLAHQTLNTQSIQTGGTFGYMDPEQFDGKVDEQSDVYALGVIFYEMLCRIKPFTGDTPINVLNKQLSKKAVPPSTHNNQISQNIDMICLKALEQNRSSRYPNMQEMYEDIAKLLYTPPVKEKKLKWIVATLFFAMLTLYFLFSAMFGIDVQKYEIALDKIELGTAAAGEQLVALIDEEKAVLENVQDKDTKERMLAIIEKTQSKLEQNYLGDIQKTLNHLDLGVLKTRKKLVQIAREIEKISSFPNHTQQSLAKTKSLHENVQDMLQKHYFLRFETIQEKFQSKNYKQQQELNWLLELSNILKQYKNPKKIPYILLLRGQIYEHLKEYKKAKEDYQKIISSNPRVFSNMDIKIAICSFRLGEASAAKKLNRVLISRYASIPKELLYEISKALMEIAFVKQNWKQVERYYFRVREIAFREQKWRHEEFIPWNLLLHEMGKDLIKKQKYKTARRWFTILKKPYLVIVCSFYMDFFNCGFLKNTKDIKESFEALAQNGKKQYRAPSFMFLSYLYFRSGMESKARYNVQQSKKLKFNFKQYKECSPLIKDVQFKIWLDDLK